MNTKEILQYLKNLEAESTLQVNGNTYTWEQVKLAQKINSDIKKELGFLPSKPNYPDAGPSSSSWKNCIIMFPIIQKRLPLTISIKERPNALPSLNVH